MALPLANAPGYPRRPDAWWTPPNRRASTHAWRIFDRPASGLEDPAWRLRFVVAADERRPKPQAVGDYRFVTPTAPLRQRLGMRTLRPADKMSRRPAIVATLVELAFRGGRDHQLLTRILRSTEHQRGVEPPEAERRR